MLYNECRRQCLQDLQVVLKTVAGTPVVNILRFFHRDGPAQQYKIGGKYSFAGCGALTSRFDDFSYCHHAPRQTFAKHQEFVLQGQVWKQRGKTIDVVFNNYVLYSFSFQHNSFAIDFVEKLVIYFTSYRCIPLDKLEVQDLKTELQMRGVETTGKKNFGKESIMCLPFSSQTRKHFWITCTLTGG